MSLTSTVTLLAGLVIASATPAPRDATGTSAAATDVGEGEGSAGERDDLPPLFLRVTSTIYDNARDHEFAQDLQQRLADAFRRRGARVRKAAEIGFDVVVGWSEDETTYKVDVVFKTSASRTGAASPRVLATAYASTNEELVAKLGGSLFDTFEGVERRAPEPALPSTDAGRPWTEAVYRSSHRANVIKWTGLASSTSLGVVLFSTGFGLGIGGQKDTPLALVVTGAAVFLVGVPIVLLADRRIDPRYPAERERRAKRGAMRAWQWDGTSLRF